MLNGELEVGLEEFGVGGNIAIGGSVTTETPIFSDEVTLTAEGISFDRDGARVIIMAVTAALGNLGPHIHFEALDAQGVVLENLHVPLLP